MANGNEKLDNVARIPAEMKGCELCLLAGAGYGNDTGILDYLADKENIWNIKEYC